tara:strand:- start:1426 stop:1527 length:102 start_codon:yes stop_codon:yes gene_type:complete
MVQHPLNKENWEINFIFTLLNKKRLGSQEERFF